MPRRETEPRTSAFDGALNDAMRELEEVGDNKTVGETLAALLEVDQAEIEDSVHRELRYVKTLVERHYSEFVLGDPRAVFAGIGFVQGVTFALAVLKIKAAR